MDYDLCVIGGGPAGYIAGIRASQLGAKVAVIEMDKLGGVCTNRGCIPTKALLEVAAPIISSGKWTDMGVGVTCELNLKQVMARMRDIVNYIGLGIKSLLDSNKVDIIKARAQFVDRYTLRINDKRTLNSKFILIASGSSPSMPDIDGIRLKGVASSDGLFTMGAVPEKAVIIGGGAIGIEYATILRSFGAEVFLIEFMDRLLPGMDPDLSAYMNDLMSGMGINVMLSCRASGILSSSEGIKIEIVPVLNHAKNAAKTINVNQIFAVTGRKPNVKGLGLDAVGVSALKGWIDVNMAMRTSIDNIYAAGDVNGMKLLAHAAFHQGSIAVENMFGKEKFFEPELVPSVVYSRPPVAQIGIDEQSAKKAGIDVKVGMFNLANSSMALVHGDPSGFVKIISEKRYGKVLGASIAGESANELISIFTTGIAGEITVDELRRAVFAHPSLSEAVGESAWAVDNLSMHTMKKGNV